ncbi:MAG: DNA polymerase III subunit beta [Magnetococcales bacterium]|nr:DNA polymerase III subunit beta [Magnetococcales bacterium]
MDFHVEREPFLKALSRIQSVVERRNTMPVLGNVLLEVDGNTLTVTATDTEIALRSTMACEVTEPGGITLPAKKLYEIVRELPDGAVRLRQATGERVIVTSERARFTLFGIAAQLFPAIPQPDGHQRITLESLVMASLFNKVHFSMSQDDGRFVLNGIFLQLDPATPEIPQAFLRMVATDSHRLAMAETPIAGDNLDPRGVIIPRKAVIEARKLLEEIQGQTELIMGEKFLQFVMPDITMITKLVEGRFPNWRRVIPEQNIHHLDTDKEVLLGVVRRMSVLSHEKSRSIHMEVRPNGLRVTTSNPEQEDANEEMDSTGTTYTGPDLDLGFNAKYLQEILSCMDGETVRFHLLNDDASVLVTSVERGHFLFVLMPMRV